MVELARDRQGWDIKRELNLERWGELRNVVDEHPQWSDAEIERELTARGGRFGFSKKQALLELVLPKIRAPGTDHLDEQEYVSILTEAAGARNGWKHILSRCAPPRRRRVPS